MWFLPEKSFLCHSLLKFGPLSGMPLERTDVYQRSLPVGTSMLLCPTEHKQNPKEIKRVNVLICEP